MGRPQEKIPVSIDDYAEESASGGCFRRFCFESDDGESNNSLLRGRGLHEEPWLVEKFKKVKEVSEVVAGPKWKNLVRKIGKICNPKKYNTPYSPESYALNFASDHGEDANLSHSFSSRFAPHGIINDHQRRPAF